MNDWQPDAHRSWTKKFRDAFRGLWVGVRGQKSFLVHLPMAAAVIACAVVFEVSTLDWCLLILSIAAVLSAELFNSALETMAQEIDREFNPNLGRALDIASGAVLVISAGAAIVGLVILGRGLLGFLGV